MEGDHQLGAVRIDANDFDDRLFALLADADQRVSFGTFRTELERRGLRATDPRLAESIAMFSSNENARLDRNTFREFIRPNIALINQTFRDQLVIADFEELRQNMDTLYEQSRNNNDGRVADYPPALAKASPEKWGLSVCSVDGQRYSIGDFNESFTLQSVSKALTYAIALNDRGQTEVHGFVGYERSEFTLKKISLDSDGKPHNPMLNSGAILTCSLVGPDLVTGERFEYIKNKFQAMAGNEPLNINLGAFMREKENAEHNKAIAHYMKAEKCFPEDTNLEAVLDLYLQLCAIEVNCESGAVLAATLANGGVCPITDERLLRSETVRDTLSVMFSSGMKDYSGQFAFKVGLPAKSGMSGCILLVVPKIMGICLWSPPLDQWNNSCRGVQFCENFNEKFHLHNFAIGRQTLLTQSIQLNNQQHREAMEVVKLLFGAYKGDVSAMKRYALQGVDMNQKDYDGRTALHVAASEGHLNVVRFLLEECNGDVDCRLTDRWGHTPLQEAQQFGHREVAALLEQRMEQ